jgi:hypothetical protein
MLRKKSSFLKREEAFGFLKAQQLKLLAAEGAAQWLRRFAVEG